MDKNTVSVKQLNFYVKTLLEGDLKLQNIYVSGEISNFNNHYSSGHWYFTLKDKDASIRCVMFRSSASKVKFAVKDGMQVVLRGRVSLYEKDGQYQFYAEGMTQGGVGEITAQFEAIKEKLASEGLFDKENKRKLPSFPKKIAVITSATGAAVQDIISILGRRNPLCEIVMCPVAVQGDLAVPEMLFALEQAYTLSDIDLIIIGRGGGSIEDLWAFNSEDLARKIYESPVPVISAVGHETDYTICDFVADLRAPTPSAAAELAVPDISDIYVLLNKYRNSMYSHLNSRYNYDYSRLSALNNSVHLKHPEYFVDNKTQLLDRLCEKMGFAFEASLNDKGKAYEKCLTKLETLNPIKLLHRGYSVVEKNGQSVTSVADVTTDDVVDIVFADGKAKGKIL